jgi:hypothetical protein
MKATHLSTNSAAFSTRFFFFFFFNPNFGMVGSSVSCNNDSLAVDESMDDPTEDAASPPAPSLCASAGLAATDARIESGLDLRIPLAGPDPSLLPDDNDRGCGLEARRPDSGLNTAVSIPGSIRETQCPPSTQHPHHHTHTHQPPAPRRQLVTQYKRLSTTTDFHQPLPLELIIRPHNKSDSSTLFLLLLEFTDK